MIKVLVKGHNGFYGLGDVLRLFYGNVKEDREAGYVCSQAPYDLLIVSEAGDMVHTYIKGEKELWDRTFAMKFGPQIEVKREIKRQLYYLLSIKTGKTFPWGSLTGIRPTVVAAEVRSAEELTDRYLVRPDKAKLCMETFKIETEVLNREAEDALNIYIGVPFCPSRCAYCSFVSQEISHHLDKVPLYAQALINEIRLTGPRLKKVSSLYMGGGTPTVFSDGDFEQVIRAIKDFIPLEKDSEITIEAGRPDTITPRKLQVLKECGIGRICINPQTLCDETLRKFNRKHTTEDFLDVFEKARKTGFDVINTDLIAGLNDERPEELLESLEKLLVLMPENITIHTLYKKRRANLKREQVLGGLSAAEGLGDRRLDEVLAKAYEMLEDKGYKPYYMYRQKDTSHGLENVGFALEGTECLYNVAMMSDKRNVLAMGAGSVSKRMFGGGRLERFSMPKDVLIYMRDLEENIGRRSDFFEDGVDDEMSQM